jgi:NAD(P)-dependent dehydrogenase (short-subunit alcohol dehydrogenase family)
MKTIVVTGGTEGIGKALARTYLDRGDNVVIIGRDGRKSLPGAHFVEADLSLLAENRRVLEEIKARFPVVDILVLCARYVLTSRRETTEGFEHGFALFYLSRFLLSHGLADSLEKAHRPVIMNVAGPGADVSVIQWDDLELTHGYEMSAALTQGGKLNDLLGVDFAQRRPGISYVLFHPGTTVTSFSGEFDKASRQHVEAMKRFGKPVQESIAPIIDILDAPPAEPLSAFIEGRRISVNHRSFDPGAAARLHDLTAERLTR